MVKERKMCEENCDDHAVDIARAANGDGWQALLVGGYVRDQIIGIDSKDIDIEIRGNFTIEELAAWLPQFGKVDLVGKSFGVFKVYVGDQALDISTPQRRVKVAAGHKGEESIPDPTMSIREAAERRDYTINSIAFDPLTNTYHDPFSGIEDLKNKRLKATSPQFRFDPLRVLRGVQQAARFDLECDDENTIQWCKDIKHEYHDLPKERIWEEWYKWAKRGRVPSKGLQFLVQTTWIDFYPPLKNLIGCEQHPAHHPEGDTWQHTLHSVDAEAHILDRAGIAGDARIIPMLATLLHDVGKPATTIVEDGIIKTPGHDKAGEQPAREFLTSIGAPKWVVEQVVPLVCEHMVHVHTPDPTPRSVRRLSVRLGKATIKQLLLVIEADHSGRPPKESKLPDTCAAIARIAHEQEIEQGKPTPILMGRDLIDIGMKPSKHFGIILAEAFEAQLDGEFYCKAGGMSWLAQYVNSNRMTLTEGQASHE